MKILLFKLGAIGDTLMTTPLVRQLRKNFPNAIIDYYIGKSSYGVLEGNQYLDNVIKFDENIFIRKQIKEWFKLINNIRKRHYDVVFVLDKHWVFNITAFLALIKKRIGFDRLGEGKFLTYKIPYFGRKHEIFYYLDLLKGLNVSVNYDDFGMDIFLTKEDELFADKFWEENGFDDKKVVAICPGGASNFATDDDLRRWPIENFIELIKKLRENNFEVLLMGGLNDKVFEKMILSNIKCVSAIGKTTLKQSAALLKKAYKVVCNDSGPMHLAAAVNNNVLAIFGPTDPNEKAPLNGSYIWKQVGCNPCYDLYGNYPKPCPYGKKCMKVISVEDVFRIIKNEI